MENETRCGYIAIVGRSNVGKSTLLNQILGRKISITSHKAQTTRHRILGIKTQEKVQAIYVDTPGFQRQTKKALNRLMNRTARKSIYDVDVIVFMIDAQRWTSEDEVVLDELKSVQCPVVLVLNKVDIIREFAKIIPSSATKSINLDVLEKFISENLPKSVHLFRDDQITNQDDKLLISEIIREKIVRITHQEIPYSTAVSVESMQMKKEVLHIDAIIWVERKGQKIIVIGKNGERLKKVGSSARIDLEKLFGCQVFLSLWVKIKEGWTDDMTILKNLGI